MSVNLYTHQAANIRKTWFLMTIFLVVVIGLGWIFAQVWGNPSILYIAIIFGVEKRWGQAFRGINVPQPNWYGGSAVGSSGRSGFSGAGKFSASMFSASFSSSFTSAFASSGGGASGGGGGAGGGGGGGAS